jgi:group I intron endonuclease
MGYIYMLENKINGKIYIGQTTRPIHTRLKEHRKGKRNCSAIYNAIQKYGWENFEKDYYECPDEDLDFDEELLVREMRTLSPNGYNLREGGGSRGKWSEESKQNLSEATQGEKNHMYGRTGEKNPLFGKTLSDDTKKKISEANSGEKNHAYGRTGERHPMYGKTHNDETKRKMSEAQIGKTPTDEHKQKNREAHLGDRNHNSRRVYQYDLYGKYIQSFASTGEAARHLEKDDGTHINKCARGERKTAYKFKWSYDEM